MRAIVWRWVTTFAAVLLAARLLPELGLPIFETEPTWQQLAIFAAILALLNAFVRPILAMITCPLQLLTLGLFTFVLNAFIFWLPAVILSEQGLGVRGPLEALIGALVVSIVSVIMSKLLP